MNGSEWPFVSVIMPVRNEADFIARSLGAVLCQKYPHDRMEVLVADGMSTDGTRKILNEIVVLSDISISIIDNPEKIVPTGFNAALKIARGEIIVRVDGHCEVATDYVIQCVEQLATGVVSGVGGPIETISDTKLGQTIALAMSSPFGVGGSSFRTVKGRAMLVDTIAFPAYIRKAMDKAGGLDTELVRNQDDEYNYRLRALGYQLLLSPHIHSRYYSRSSLTKLWSQYYEYGLYKVRVMQKHPRQMRPRQFVPLSLVLALLVGAIFSPFIPIVRFLWIFTLLTYIAANLGISMLTSAKFGRHHMPFLPIVFGILHFSYGIGFLNGLWEFRGRWGDT